MKSLLQKFYSLPTFLQSWLKTLAKFSLWLISWLILGVLFNALFAPEKRPPSAVFSVCVLQNQQPQRIFLSEFNRQPLCDHPVKNVSNGNEAFYFNLEKIKQITPTLSEWEVSDIGDSPSDPIVSRYRIDNTQPFAKPIPLWETRGGWTTAFLSWLLSLVLSFVLYGLFKKLVRVLTAQNLP